MRSSVERSSLISLQPDGYLIFEIRKEDAMMMMARMRSNRFVYDNQNFPIKSIRFEAKRKFLLFFDQIFTEFLIF